MPEFVAVADFGERNRLSIAIRIDCNFVMRSEFLITPEWCERHVHKLYAVWAPGLIIQLDLGKFLICIFANWNNLPWRGTSRD